MILVTVVSLIWLMVAMVAASSDFQLFSKDPDILRNTSQLLASRGFHSELHHPITADGYILTLVRLVNPNLPLVRYPGSRRPAVYLQHGLFGNGDDFLLSQDEILKPEGLWDRNTRRVTNCTGLDPQSVGRSVAYVLSACGYDVWLGNHRGNRYSNAHILLNPNTDNQFWSFTVDHLSNYDLPANIDYILSETGHSQLTYIGHSLGTSVMFQLLSTRPEYGAKIKPVIMLAPVAHVSHIRAPLLLLGAYTPPLIKYLSVSNMPFFGLPGPLLTLVDQTIATFICGNSLLRPFCTIFLFTLCGFDWPNTNQSIIPFTYAHFPDDTSARVLAHLAQRVTMDTFSFFDYGESINQKYYDGSSVPPVYNLSRIDSRYLIFVSGINDWLADPDDVAIIRSQLSVPPYRDYTISYELFNHNDFLMGTNVGKYQNTMILQWMHELWPDH